MAKFNFNSDTLFSAVKRKNVGDILAFVFNEVGETAAAEVIASKTRITDAALTEVRGALVGGEATANEEVSNDPEREDDEVAIEETKSIPDHDFKDIKKAIKKGKKKKALKLITAAKDAGARGSVLKGLNKDALAL